MARFALDVLEVDGEAKANADWPFSAPCLPPLTVWCLLLFSVEATSMSSGSLLA